MKLMIAVSIADCKAYCIDEFLKCLDKETKAIDFVDDWHIIIYGDRLVNEGYILPRLSTWVEAHKDKVTYLPGIELENLNDDNIYNSKAVAQVRENTRQVALCADWWDTLLFWDCDVFPLPGALSKLAAVMEESNGDIVAGLVADWSSEMPSVALFDESTDELKLVWPLTKLEANKDYQVGVTHLAFTLIKRPVLEAIPFVFDERVVAWGDDGYLCREAYKQGFSIITTSKVETLHVHESFKGNKCEIVKDGVVVSVYRVPTTTVEHAGKEEALIYVRDDAGGHFPAPIDWTFHRGKPVPVRLLGDMRVNLLLEGPAFRKIMVTRNDMEVANNIMD
jgi:hypothetical protein